ncbi:MAG TPA: DegV family protein [Candidatus Gemmiger faecigallinarum]|nr:DegV family protein [Candidatus Gemmiger faecigallinarum]
MKKIVLVAETGSDIPPETAAKYDIRLAPMHVSFDGESRDDGGFPPEEIYAWYKHTGRLPTTTGCSPEDFARVFDEIHTCRPDAHILYLAYSAATTVSFQSALLAAEGRDYVTALDTRQVTVGQGAIVEQTARVLQANPALEPEPAAAIARNLIGWAEFVFFPNDLDYLRAGGRVSNVAYLGSRLLHLHPAIELQNGKLVAAKKYRGRLEGLAPRLLDEYMQKWDLQTDRLWLVYTAGLDLKVRAAVNEAARARGFRQLTWVQANGVITTHGGPGAFGFAGFRKK